MNTIISKFSPSLKLLAVLIFVIAIATITVAANPAVGPTTSAPGGNPESLVNTSLTAQVKGGSSLTGAGLGVGTFLASSNAQFNTLTYIKGMLTGAPITTDPKFTKLNFGDSLADVTLAVNGTTYTQSGGLYSTKIVTAAGTLKPICATTNGDIILCGGQAPTVVPPTAGRRHYTLSGDQDYQRTFSDKNTYTYTDCSNCNLFTGKLDTSKVVVDTLPGFTPSDDTLDVQPTVVAGAIMNDWIPDGSNVWTVPSDGKYNIKFASNGYLSSTAKHDNNRYVRAEFYLRVNGTLVPMIVRKAPFYQNYPAPSDPGDYNCGERWNYKRVSQYDSAVISINQGYNDYVNAGRQYSIGCGGVYNGGSTITTLFNLKLDQDFDLKAGDKVNFVLKGVAQATNDSFANNQVTSVDFRMHPYKTSFDVTEL